MRQAREILERWQSSDLFERISGTGPLASPKSTERNARTSIPWQPSQAPLETQSVVFSNIGTEEPANTLASLIAPSPLLATSSPSCDEEESYDSAAPMNPVLVAGVEETRHPAAMIPQTIRAVVPDTPPEPQAVAVVATDPRECSAAETPPSAESAPSALTVPLTTSLIHEDSAEAESEPAESTSESQSAEFAASKKIQRKPMRRPPLHRRFQLDRPVSVSPSGADAVTRKLRLDQPDGSAETPEVAESAESLVSSVAPDTKIVSNSPKPGQRFRIDSAESVSEVTGTDGRRARTHGLPKRRFIDESHEPQLRGPHFEVSTPRRSNLTSVTGQFLAYLGVLGLTIGTSIVIYGHFGGYSDYTPTGWLVTTVAQMLLFLGVINLVSGGIEQNNEDVSRRINTLGEQLLRIELVTSEVLRGPKISPRLYDNPDAESEERARENIMAERD